MRQRHILTTAAMAAAIALAGCSTGPTSGLVTSSVTEPSTKIAAAPAADPMCTALSQQISATRAEGTPARVHAVANGKTKMVQVKRELLAKVAELDRLNSEFQQKCSKVPAQQTAALKPATPVPAKTSALALANAAAANQAASKTAKLAKTTATTQPIIAVPR